MNRMLRSLFPASTWLGLAPPQEPGGGVATEPNAGDEADVATLTPPGTASAAAEQPGEGRPAAAAGPVAGVTPIPVRASIPLAIIMGGIVGAGWFIGWQMNGPSGGINAALLTGIVSGAVFGARSKRTIRAAIGSAIIWGMVGAIGGLLGLLLTPATADEWLMLSAVALGTALIGGAAGGLIIGALYKTVVPSSRDAAAPGAPPTPHLKHSGLGIASLMAFGVMAAAFMLAVQFSINMLAVVGLAILAGVVLSLAGLFQRSRDHTFARLGLFLNGGTLLVALSVPNFSASCGGGGGKISSVKANMHAIQLGVEQYAGDNYGNYPDGVLDKGFKWDTYVPSKPRNPIDQSIQGSANMEPDVKTAGTKGGPVYLIAQTYAGTGRPGTMRYFSDTGNRSTYALIGYDREGKIIKETAAANAANYVLHN